MVQRRQRGQENSGTPEQKEEKMATDNGKMQVELPAGMTEEQFQKLFNTFKKQRVEGGAKDKANRKALKVLMDENEGRYKFLQKHYIDHPEQDPKNTKAPAGEVAVG